jgi:hypothetical protein
VTGGACGDRRACRSGPIGGRPGNTFGQAVGNQGRNPTPIRSAFLRSVADGLAAHKTLRNSEIWPTAGEILCSEPIATTRSNRFALDLPALVPCQKIHRPMSINAFDCCRLCRIVFGLAQICNNFKLAGRCCDVVESGISRIFTLCPADWAAST